MLQPGHGRGFLPETQPCLGGFQLCAAECLQRHLARRLLLPRSIDYAHPAPGNLPEQLVPPDHPQRPSFLCGLKRGGK